MINIKKVKIIVSLILVILWLIAIFMFSADNAKESSGKSMEIASKVAQKVYKEDEVKREKLAKDLNHPIRKCAHATVYFILSILVMNLIFQITINRKKIYYLYNIIFCFLYACSDEYHQLFVQGRSGELRDILLDTCGAILGFLVYLGMYKLIKRIKKV